MILYYDWYTFIIFSFIDPISVSNWELWQDIWHELAPGTETALARHIDEICSLLSSVLQSASWHVKAQVQYNFILVI